MPPECKGQCGLDNPPCSCLYSCFALFALFFLLGNLGQEQPVGGRFSAARGLTMWPVNACSGEKQDGLHIHYLEYFLSEKRKMMSRNWECSLYLF